MQHDKQAQNGPPGTSASSSTPEAKVQKKGRKNAKPSQSEARVPMTFSFSVSFAKKLKGLGGFLPESLSDFVEARLSGLVQRELKKILEEMG